MENEKLHEKIDLIKNKMGKEILSEEELLILAAFEISKTYTRDEKQYSV